MIQKKQKLLLNCTIILALLKNKNGREIQRHVIENMIMARIKKTSSTSIIIIGKNE